MSSDPLSADDLQAIRAPEHAPAEKPDPKTESEERVAKKLTPTQQIAELQKAHIDTLTCQITYHRDQYEILKGEHKGHCEEFKLVIASQQTQIDQLREKSDRYADRCARLEQSAVSSGQVAFLSTVAGVASGALMGYAGSMPGTDDTLKASLTGAGVFAVIASGVLGFVAYRLGSPGKSDVPKPQPGESGGKK